MTCQRVEGAAPGNHKRKYDSEKDAGGVVFGSAPPYDVELPKQPLKLLESAPAKLAGEMQLFAALFWH